MYVRHIGKVVGRSVVDVELYLILILPVDGETEGEGHASVPLSK